ncbi:hypothetical protein AVEN_240463-1 [Araneus ventricosus]|uniref:Uncharacterized protein n=1 Tax=Araneus ventricosus TaxID=182803 RepID=A0A4Y2KTG1_ARAVE|nr:hypothetical protein AVEN_240463-1 [Araneus ventricosus]
MAGSEDGEFLYLPSYLKLSETVEKALISKCNMNQEVRENAKKAFSEFKLLVLKHFEHHKSDMFRDICKEGLSYVAEKRSYADAVALPIAQNPSNTPPDNCLIVSAENFTSAEVKKILKAKINPLSAKAFPRKPFRKPLPQSLRRKAFYEPPVRQSLKDRVLDDVDCTHAPSVTPPYSSIDCDSPAGLLARHGICLFTRDARSLMKTSYSVAMVPIEPGHYSHIGLAVNLRSIWKKVKENISTSYQSARSHLREAEGTSNLETDAECMRPCNRRKKFPHFPDSSSEDKSQSLLGSRQNESYPPPLFLHL